MPSALQFSTLFKVKTLVRGVLVGLKPPNLPLSAIKQELENEMKTCGPDNLEKLLAKEKEILAGIKQRVTKINQQAVELGTELLKGTQQGDPKSNMCLMEKKSHFNHMYPQKERWQLRQQHDWLLSRQLVAKEILNSDQTHPKL